MRILLIEDDPAIADVVARGLEAEGFEIDVALTGTDGLWRAIEGSYVAIILDLLLPEMNGYDVCRKVREAGVETPILVLTAKTGEYDHIDLLELGADDFVSKPASITMLLARVRALLRRGRQTDRTIHTAGSMAYDESAQLCTLDGDPVELTAREQSVLVTLLRADGFLKREDLIRAVWGLDFDGDPSIIDVYLRRVRDKLGSDLIENRRGIGYRIESRVQTR